MNCSSQNNNVFAHPSRLDFATDLVYAHFSVKQSRRNTVRNVLLAAGLALALTVPAQAGVNGKLMSAYRYVKARCAGVRVVSGVRRTRIRGSRRRSLHWTGNALDFRASSYRCAYRALRRYGWRYGMSRDGSRCRHIHISYGGRHRERNGFRHRYC